MKTVKLTLFVLVLSAQLAAQCPASITATVSATAADCPSSGTATINTTPAHTASFIFMLTAGPSGATLNAPQASNVFNALQAGNYTAHITCGGTQTDIGFTITDNYTPLTAVSASVNINCGSFSPQAQVTIAATGGTAPLQYSIVQSADPNYPDASSIYTGSPIKNCSSHGTYQVRVKDACNQFYTKTVSVTSPLPAVQVQSEQFFNAGCGTEKADALISIYEPLAQVYQDFNPYFAQGGIKIRFWEQDPGGNCMPAGPLLFETVVTNWDTIRNIPITASKKYYIQTITACGDTSSYCTDISAYVRPTIYIQTLAAGCAGDPVNPQVMNIYSRLVRFMKYPVTITVTNGAGSIVHSSVLNSAADTLRAINLPMDDYTVTAVDACGNTDINHVNNPAAAGVAGYDFTWYSATGCSSRPGPGTTQSGTTTGFLSGWGYLPNLASADFTIIAGPSNIGIKGFYDGWGNMIWYNLLPGAYTIRVTTECGIIDYPVTVAPPASDIFMHTISAAAASTCGGSGTINATVVSTANSSSNFNLVSISTGLTVATNLSGNFSNVAPGNYYVQMATPDCEGNNYYINSNAVTISSGTGPQVIKKIGTACEDSNGNPLSTGTAYLSVAGGAPLLVEFKLTSAVTWSTFSTNAANDFAIPGLQANSVYDVRITSCGITTATQVTIERLGHIANINHQQPCDLMQYEMSLPQMPGASYEWINPSGAVVSNTYNYTIASYNNSYNGMYVGKLIWSGCLLRTDTIKVSSLYCGGGLLPVNIVSFTGKATANTVVLSCAMANQTGYNNFTIERSRDGISFTPISNAISAGIDNHFNYVDNNPLAGTSYYRLKIMDEKGVVKYSKLVAITFVAAGKIILQPTLTHTTVTVSGLKAGYLIQVYDAIGKLVTTAKTTNTTASIDLSPCTKGIYTVVITKDNSWLHTSKIIRD
jgi:hypothetical protein